jgi:hypothetical protein
MKIKQNGGVQKSLKVVNSCKSFLSKVLLIMKFVHDIVTIAKNSESNVSKATESNTSKDTNNYISVANELVETSSKRQKKFNSFIPQTRNTNMAIFDNGASSSYPNNLTMKLKEYADPNWVLDIPCTMSAQRIPNPYKKICRLFLNSQK